MTDREKITKEEQAKDAEEKLVQDVLKDFSRRQEERRTIERGWQLNMNFLNGNQYFDLNRMGELEEKDGDFYWQERRVFNYIAPTIDMRLAKLARIRPKLAVRAASDDEADLHSAKIASAILTAVSEDSNVEEEILAATVWSETCGTAFYKVVWNPEAGNLIGGSADGKGVHEGGVKVTAVSPFEIYPYTLSEERIENQPSIIHARAVSADDIFAAYGVKLAGRDIDEFSFSPYARNSSDHITGDKAVKHGYETVIERYERPTADMPDGRLTIVAGDRLVYDGKLPYANGLGGTRGYPFVKQNCISQAGAFFGACVIDRLIPVQRAYNAVKNRKHEFLNRIAMGTIAVEDGSVDTDELAEEGFAPGKILVYRQGGNPPEMLSFGSVPSEFGEEEQKLIDEFDRISGSGELTQDAMGFNAVTSATGLQLIIEQDEARLNVSYDQIKSALKNIGRQTLRLYRQFATDLRLMKYAGTGNALSLFYFKGSDITSDDVVLESDSEINLSPAQRRSVIYDMMDKGLFSDDDGKISLTVKNKILSLLGYKGLGGGRDIGELHRARCGEENLALKTRDTEVKPYDDHDIHISEHTAFLLSEKLDTTQEERFIKHLEAHRAAKNAELKKEENLKKEN